MLIFANLRRYLVKISSLYGYSLQTYKLRRQIKIDFVENRCSVKCLLFFSIIKKVYQLHQIVSRNQS